MRDRFRDATERLIAKEGEQALKIRAPSTERFQVEMYLDYWYAGIFAAVQGYEKLALTDLDVERLRPDPLHAKLRAYRAGTYHFREKYFDDPIREFLQSPNSASWLLKLHVALGRFLLTELGKESRRVGHRDIIAG